MINQIKKEFKLWIDLLNGRTIIIYQMAKVGSSTIYKALKHVDIANTHLHYMGKNRLIKRKKSRKMVTPILKFAELIRIGCFKTRHKKPKKIISLVRDPIARNVSLMFNLLHILIYEYRLDNKHVKEEFQVMLENILLNYVNTEESYKWFSTELKKSTGVDIFEFPFDKERGYCRIEKNGFDILILRLDKMSELSNVIEEFVGVPSLVFKDENKGEDMWYSDIYQDFRNKFIPSSDYIDCCYNNKHMDYFYTTNEVKALKDKWEKRI